eukprot:COSAG06_NODE_2447_length_6864_cov_3.888101_4_plen_69_part_00
MSQKSRDLAKLFNMRRVGMRSNEFQKFGQMSAKLAILLVAFCAYVIDGLNPPYVTLRGFRFKAPIVAR